MWNNNIPTIERIQIKDIPCILVSSNSRDQENRGYLIILHKQIGRAHV